MKDRLETRAHAELSLFGETATYEGPACGSDADAAFAASLPLALVFGRTMTADGVSPLLVGNAGRIAEILCEWLPVWNYQPVWRGISGSPRTPQQRHGPRSLFFSGGLDSVHALAKHMDEVDEMVLVHGFDVPVDKDFTPVFEAAASTAGYAKKALTVVKTDLRKVTDKNILWAPYHGAALAMIALLRGSGRAYIGSTYSYAQLIPWGSHPLLDRLWSTETTKICHTGSECGRSGKIRFIARTHPELLRRLRVCWIDGATENCGQCEKCIRTVLDLRIAGESRLCDTLPRSIDPAAIRRIRLSSGALAFWRHYPESPELPDEIRNATRRVIADARAGIAPRDGSLRGIARRWRDGMRAIAGVLGVVRS
jgi:hypothetical protein